MTAGSQAPVLLLGGSGIVGSRAAHMLRKRHPQLPLVIAGRQAASAARVATEVGGPTTSTVVDLSRDDLGLPPDAAFSAMAVLFKDAGLRSLRYAQRKRVPYVAFSDFAYDIAATVAQIVAAPDRTAVLLLGHMLGGIATLAALHFANELQDIEAIDIVAVVGNDDTGGPAAQADFSAYAGGGHGALLLRSSETTWVKDAAAARTVVDGTGSSRLAYALPLLDVGSLAAATRARAVRVDMAARGPGERTSFTELIVALRGTNQEGAPTTVRVTLSDEDVHARMSAQGLAIALERMAGLDGAPPVAPGLYHPETIVVPAAAMKAVVALGTRIHIERTLERRLKVGIIGSGNIGGALVRRLRALGHEVFVANARGPASLADLAAETGAKAVSVHAAARAGEIVIVAVPEEAVARLPRDLFEGVPASTVVVDTGNYYPRHRDGRIEPIEAGATESRWVANVLGRPVVKAFNNVWAKDLLLAGRPSGAGDRFALPIAGDSAEAKATVAALVSALGFDTVDAGGLDDSWRQQPNTPVYTANRDVAGTTRLLAEARRERSPELTGTASSPGSWAEPR